MLWCVQDYDVFLAVMWHVNMMWSWCDKIATGFGSVDYVARLRCYWDNAMWHRIILTMYFLQHIRIIRVRPEYIQTGRLCPRTVSILHRQCFEGTWGCRGTYDLQFLVRLGILHLSKRVFSLFSRCSPKTHVLHVKKLVCLGTSTNQPMKAMWKHGVWGASEKAHFHVLIANVLQGNEAGNGNDWWPTCPSSTSAHLGGWEMPQLKARCLQQAVVKQLSSLNFTNVLLLQIEHQIIIIINNNNDNDNNDNSK